MNSKETKFKTQELKDIILNQMKTIYTKYKDQPCIIFP